MKQNRVMKDAGRYMLVSETMYPLLRKWFDLYQDFILRFHYKNHAKQNIDCSYWKYWKFYGSTIFLYISLKFTLNFQYINIFFLLKRSWYCTTSAWTQPDCDQIIPKIFIFLRIIHYKNANSNPDILPLDMTTFEIMTLIFPCPLF